MKTALRMHRHRIGLPVYPRALISTGTVAVSRPCLVTLQLSLLLAQHSNTLSFALCLATRVPLLILILVAIPRAAFDTRPINASPNAYSIPEQ